jgi:hypothetical protein
MTGSYAGRVDTKVDFLRSTYVLVPWSFNTLIPFQLCQPSLPPWMCDLLEVGVLFQPC